MLNAKEILSQLELSETPIFAWESLNIYKLNGFPKGLFIAGFNIYSNDQKKIYGDLYCKIFDISTISETKLDLVTIEKINLQNGEKIKIKLYNITLKIENIYMRKHSDNHGINQDFMAIPFDVLGNEKIVEQIY